MSTPRRQVIADVVRLDGGWRVATVTAQRETHDSLVVVNGWAFCTEGAGSLGGTVRLSLERFHRHADGSCSLVERDPKHGDVFTSAADAYAYALNRGAVRWYSELRGQRLIAAATEVSRLMDEMCLMVERDPELGDILATGYPFAGSLDEVSHQVGAWRDEMDVAVRRGPAPRARVAVEVCPLCRKPAHASETDDSGKHPECAAKERGIVP